MFRHIRPLDCIFFQGTEFVSKTIIQIEKLTLGIGEWSHVGIVVNKEVMPSLKVKDDDLYVWESTISSRNKLISEDPTLDAESNSPVFGVQIRKLKDVINNGLKSGVKIGWGKLINNPIDRFKDEDEKIFELRLKVLQDTLDKVHKENYHRPYTKNICRLLAAMFTCCSCCRHDCCFGEDWRFCSQFVSVVYKAIGVLSDVIDPETVVPQDIATPEVSEERLPKILEDVKVINFI